MIADTQADKLTFSAFSGTARRLDGKASKLSPSSSGSFSRGNSFSNSVLQVWLKDKFTFNTTRENTVEYLLFFSPLALGNCVKQSPGSSSLPKSPSGSGSSSKGDESDKPKFQAFSRKGYRL